MLLARKPSENPLHFTIATTNMTIKSTSQTRQYHLPTIPSRLKLGKPEYVHGLQSRARPFFFTQWLFSRQALKTCPTASNSPNQKYKGKESKNGGLHSESSKKHSGTFSAHGSRGCCGRDAGSCRSSASCCRSRQRHQWQRYNHELASERLKLDSSQGTKGRKIRECVPESSGR